MLFRLMKFDFKYLLGDIIWRVTFQNGLELDLSIQILRVLKHSLFSTFLYICYFQTLLFLDLSPFGMLLFNSGETSRMCIEQNLELLNFIKLSDNEFFMLLQLSYWQIFNVNMLKFLYRFINEFIIEIA